MKSKEEIKRIVDDSIWDCGGNPVWNYSIRVSVENSIETSVRTSLLNIPNEGWEFIVRNEDRIFANTFGR